MNHEGNAWLSPDSEVATRWMVHPACGFAVRWQTCCGTQPSFCQAFSQLRSVPL